MKAIKHLVVVCFQIDLGLSFEDASDSVIFMGLGGSINLCFNFESLRVRGPRIIRPTYLLKLKFARSSVVP